MMTKMAENKIATKIEKREKQKPIWKSNFRTYEREFHKNKELWFVVPLPSEE